MLYKCAYNFTQILYLRIEPLVKVGFDVVVCELYICIGTGIVCTVSIVNLALHHLSHIFHPFDNAIIGYRFSPVSERVKTAVSIVVYHH